MKIGVIGTGAVGGYFGAKLAIAGQDVTFFGTEKSASIIKNKGLFVKSPKGNIEIKNPKIFSSFEEIKNMDLILLCTKAYDTEKIAAQIKTKMSPNALIISLQNGINNEEILSEILGKENVIMASVYLSASSMEAGFIDHAGSGKIILGEQTKEITPRLKSIEKLFLDSSIPSSTSEDLKKDMWKKLLVNSAYNGFTALINGTLKHINSVESARLAYFDVVKEGQKIASADGTKISDEEIEDIMKMLDQQVFINFKSSTLQDLEKNKKLEIDAIQGEIIRIAYKHNLKAPLNNLIYSLLKLKEMNNG